MSSSKKVFTSEKSDTGLYVKFLKEKTSISFWGDGEPSKITFSNEEVKGMCEFILKNLDSEKDSKKKGDALSKFELAYKEVKRRTPRNQNF
jgi:hypothetical protein